jgi:hypothetical protein
MAGQVFDGQDIEIWQGAHFVSRLQLPNPLRTRQPTAGDRLNGVSLLSQRRAPERSDDNILRFPRRHLLEPAWSFRFIFQRSEETVGPKLDVVAREHLE